MTEEPKIFGERQPFTLIHGDDLKEVTRFLLQRGVSFTRTVSGPSLYKLRFSDTSADDARVLMRELWRASTPLTKTPNP